MKRLSKWAFFAAFPLLLLLSLSASAATAPAGKAKPIKPRTILVEKGLIHGFAQDGNAIAWIAGRWQRPWSVYVRGLDGRKTWAVGKADESAYQVPGRVITLPLALAGTRVLWTTFSAGAGWVYTDVAMGAPRMRQVFVNEYQIWAPGPNESPVPGVVGDGATLAYGVVLEDCPTLTYIPRDCPELYSGPGKGVVVVAHRYNPPAIGGIPPPVMLALSQGRVAVVPAASPRPNDGVGPRPVVNGPVKVYDLTGQLLSTVNPVGTVRDVALAWPRLSVIVERPNGMTEIERYNASTGKRLLGLTGNGRLPLAATDLAASDAGVVFRARGAIYFLGSHERTLRSVWHVKGTPIGLSIEGRRVAWAVNLTPVRPRGSRIVALTLPRYGGGD